MCIETPVLRGLSGKSPAIINVTRTVCVTLMYLYTQLHQFKNIYIKLIRQLIRPVCVCICVYIYIYVYVYIYINEDVYIYVHPHFILNSLPLK